VAAFLKDIAPILEQACARGTLDAAALAVVHDGQVFEHAWGLANRREEIAATPDTLFHIGSATKSITAELVWQLIGDGRLGLDTPVIGAAPELSHIATLRDERLTIGHLLSHTGGLDGDVIFDAGRGRDVLRRYMEQIGEIGSLHAPGSQFSYANVGYGILGRIVEVAGGQVFEDALATRLRGHHKLTRVAILPIEKIRQRTALFFSGERPDYFGPYSNIASGTVLAMSMGDLARWAGSHLEKDGAVPALTEQMRRPAVALPHNHRYQGWGYGVSLLDDLGRSLIGHDGGTAGTATFMRVAPHRGTAWAMAATGGAAVAVYREVEPHLRRLAGLPDQLPRNPSGRPVPDDLSVYEGSYRRHGMTFDIAKGPDRTLIMTITGAMAPTSFSGLTLHPVTAQVFSVRIPALDAEIWASFHEFDEAGKPQLFFVLERMTRRGDAA
jgi:CubicO group peptidase (beta-lactamase class C family)